MVEDSTDDAALVLGALEAGPFVIESLRVETAEEMKRALARGPWDMVVSDYSLPRFSAAGALTVLGESGQDIPCIIVSGFVGEEAAVELVKAGATDFVAKSNLERLIPASERGLREARVARERRAAVTALQESESRFKAIASNLPGVVFQAICEADGVRMIYVSDGCQALLGVSPSTLMERPEAFVEMIHPDDRFHFHRTRLRSLRTFRPQNWEGPIRLPGSGETKWVNLRAGVRELPSGEIVMEGIVSNITQGKLAEMELLRSREQLRELSSHLHKIKEEERAHIAREIHDELGSILTAAKIDLSSLDRALPPERMDLVTKAASVDILLDSAMEISSRISRSLRPGVLDYGIAAAIEWQAREFEKRMGIPCGFDCTNDDLQLAPEPSTALFRIFQETLTNISKHAHARQVRVELLERGNDVVLRVADDGCGIGDADLCKPASFGISGMRERARFLGGQLRVARRAEGGTEVEVTLPYERSSIPELPALGQLTLFDS